MVIVDTSVWIDFFAAKHTRQTDILLKKIEYSEDLCICGLIMTEVLQGIKSEKEYEKVKGILSNLIYLPISKDMFLGAASIYRKIRKNGETIRSPIDCIIAAICLKHEVKILHNDKDYNVIASHTLLKFAE
jgi:predicted nucleic acid-binding protein